MNQRYLSFGILSGDLLWSTLAMVGAIVLRYGSDWRKIDINAASALLPFLASTWVIWTLLFLSLSLDGFRDGWRLSAVVSQLLLGVGGVMLILLSGGYLARRYVSRLALVQFCLLLLAGFVLVRIAVYLILRVRSSQGFSKRIVIVGRGRLVRELARKIQRHPEMLCKVVGILAPDDGSSDSNFPAAGPPSVSIGTLGIVDTLVAQKIAEVILVLEECVSPELASLATLCRGHRIKVSLVPPLDELYLSRLRLTDLGGLPVLQLSRPGRNAAALVAKRAFDLVLGTLLSVASAPVLVPVALMLRHIKGQAFRWETRCGFHGKPFSMLRLNVDRMASGASRFERMLRRTSLTELPQLWNVLRGDMSLVGPRPESRDRVCRYSEWQQQRLTVKPGMTGLAQVQGLREQHSSEDKTRFDLQYLLNCSVWTDLSLLLQTVWTLATRSGERRDLPAEIGTQNEHLIPVKVQREILDNAHRP